MVRRYWREQENNQDNWERGYGQCQHDARQNLVADAEIHSTRRRERRVFVEHISKQLDAIQNQQRADLKSLVRQPNQDGPYYVDTGQASRVDFRLAAACSLPVIPSHLARPTPDASHPEIQYSEIKSSKWMCLGERAMLVMWRRVTENTRKRTSASLA